MGLTGSYRVEISPQDGPGDTVGAPVRQEVPAGGTDRSRVLVLGGDSASAPVVRAALQLRHSAGEVPLDGGTLVLASGGAGALGRAVGLLEVAPGDAGCQARDADRLAAYRDLDGFRSAGLADLLADLP